MDYLKSIALLVDGDNVPRNSLSDILYKASSKGRVSVKRIYGNWSKPYLADMEEDIIKHGFNAMQQFDYVYGKNATDMAMVVDAMKLFATGLYDGYVIASSDSDFTPLATALRESGATVIGMGEAKTPEGFRCACDEFILLETQAEDRLSKGIRSGIKDKQDKEVDSDKCIMMPAADFFDDEPVGISGIPDTTENIAAINKTSQKKNCEDVHRMVREAAERSQYGVMTAYISYIGQYIHAKDPRFSIKEYGYPSLVDFLKSFPDRYELKDRSGRKGLAGGTYILCSVKNAQDRIKKPIGLHSIKSIRDLKIISS